MAEFIQFLLIVAVLDKSYENARPAAPQPCSGPPVPGENGTWFRLRPALSMRRAIGDALALAAAWAVVGYWVCHVYYSRCLDATRVPAWVIAGMEIIPLVVLSKYAVMLWRGADEITLDIDARSVRRGQRLRLGQSPRAAAWASDIGLCRHHVAQKEDRVGGGHGLGLHRQCGPVARGPRPLSKIVVNASVGMKWLVPEVHAAASVVIVQRDLWPEVISNACRSACSA